MSEDEIKFDAPKKYTAKTVEPDTEAWEKFQNSRGTRKTKSDSK